MRFTLLAKFVFIRLCVYVDCAAPSEEADDWPDCAVESADALSGRVVFQCPSEALRIWSLQSCDGVRHCHSGFDERCVHLQGLGHHCLRLNSSVGLPDYCPLVDRNVTRLPDSPLNASTRDAAHDAGRGRSGGKEPLFVVRLQWPHLGCATAICHDSLAWGLTPLVAHLGCRALGFGTYASYGGVRRRAGPARAAVAPGMVQCRGTERTLHQCLASPTRLSTNCSHLFAVRCRRRCACRLTEPSGTVTSPAYPTLALPDLRCSWSFRANQSDRAFVFRFEKLNIYETARADAPADIASPRFSLRWDRRVANRSGAPDGSLGLRQKCQDSFAALFLGRVRLADGRVEPKVVRVCDLAPIAQVNFTSTESEVRLVFFSGPFIRSLAGVQGFKLQYWTVPADSVANFFDANYASDESAMSRDVLVKIVVGFAFVAVVLVLYCTCTCTRALFARRRFESINRIHKTVHQPKQPKKVTAGAKQPAPRLLACHRPSTPMPFDDVADDPQPPTRRSRHRSSRFPSVNRFHPLYCDVCERMTPSAADVCEHLQPMISFLGWSYFGDIAEGRPVTRSYFDEQGGEPAVGRALPHVPRCAYPTNTRTRMMRASTGSADSGPYALPDENNNSSNLLSPPPCSRQLNESELYVELVSSEQTRRSVSALNLTDQTQMSSFVSARADFSGSVLGVGRSVLHSSNSGDSSLLAGATGIGGLLRASIVGMMPAAGVGAVSYSAAHLPATTRRTKPAKRHKRRSSSTAAAALAAASGAATSRERFDDAAPLDFCHGLRPSGDGGKHRRSDGNILGLNRPLYSSKRTRSGPDIFVDEYVDMEPGGGDDESSCGSIMPDVVSSGRPTSGAPYNYEAATSTPTRRRWSTSDQF